MNRRDALKKLGAGTAIAAGVSTVRVVPAFAYSAPTMSPAMSFVFVSQDQSGNSLDPDLIDGFTIRWRTGTGRCPASATSAAVLATPNFYGPGEVSKYYLSVTQVFPTTGYFAAITSLNPLDGSPVEFNALASGHFIQIVSNTGAPNNNDQIEFYAFVGFRCNYVGGSQNDLFELYGCVTYSSALNSWSLAQGQCGA